MQAASKSALAQQARRKSKTTSCPQAPTSTPMCQAPPLWMSQQSRPHARPWLPGTTVTPPKRSKCGGMQHEGQPEFRLAFSSQQSELCRVASFQSGRWACSSAYRVLLFSGTLFYMGKSNQNRSKVVIGTYEA